MSKRDERSPSTAALARGMIEPGVRMQQLSTPGVANEWLDLLPALVMISGAQGEVLFFNRAWRDFTGQASLDEPWSDVLHPDDAPRIAEDWRKSVEHGADEIAMEYRLRDQHTGAYRWFAARAVAMRDGGVLQGWIGVAVDVHERKSNEDSLIDLYFQERHVAHKFQIASLSRALPKVHGCQLDVLYVPSAAGMDVGGDWYDAFVLTDNRLVICIGDVMGHNVDAAIVMAKLRQTFRALAHPKGTAETPAELIRCAEDTILSEYPDALATAFVGILDAERRTMTYSSAGHPAAMFRHPGGDVTESRFTGVLLGAPGNVPRTNETIDLQGVELVFLYTDGLVESNYDYDADTARLRGFLATWDTGNVNNLCAEACAALTKNQTHDDIAALALSLSPAPR